MAAIQEQAGGQGRRSLSAGVYGRLLISLRVCGLDVVVVAAAVRGAE